MTELLHRPGFLGTSANWAADMTLVASAVVVLLLTIGVLLAVRGQYRAHRLFQTSAATLNAILVLWLMVLPFRDFVAPATNPAGLPLSAIATTRIHAAVGTIALVFGLFVTLRANNLMPRFLRFNNYKAYMRVAYLLYMLASLIGLFVYITWFVGNPNPPLY
ncbi:MAG TPA: hypothetical protein VF434_04550 [Promineifilum sp.]